MTSALAKSAGAFVPFTLKSVVELTPNTRRFTFALPSDQTLGLSVSSLVLAKIGDIMRPYTPVSPVTQTGSFDLIIKIYEKGAFGQAISKLEPGAEVLFKGPIVKYEYKCCEWSTVGMIAGGSGITPMLQVAQEILANPKDTTKIVLVFGNVSETDIICRKEIDELKAQNAGRIDVHYILDKPSADWTGLKGHVDQELLAKVLPPTSDEKCKVLVCGPPGMMNAISGPKAEDKSQGELAGVLEKMGYSKAQVFKY